MVASGTSEGLRATSAIATPPASIRRVDFDSSWHNNYPSAPSPSSPAFAACAPDPRSLNRAGFVGAALIQNDLPG